MSTLKSVVVIQSFLKKFIFRKIKSFFQWSRESKFNHFCPLNFLKPWLLLDKNYPNFVYHPVLILHIPKSCYLKKCCVKLEGYGKKGNCDISKSQIGNVHVGNGPHSPKKTYKVSLVNRSNLMCPQIGH